MGIQRVLKIMRLNETIKAVSVSRKEKFND